MFMYDVCDSGEPHDFRQGVVEVVGFTYMHAMEIKGTQIS